MRVDISNDRRPVQKSDDPVCSKTGVFSLLDEDDLSEVEQQRAQRIEAREEVRKRSIRRVWLPRDVSRKLTNLYKRLGKSGK